MELSPRRQFRLKWPATMPMVGLKGRGYITRASQRGKKGRWTKVREVSCVSHIMRVSYHVCPISGSYHACLNHPTSISISQSQSSNIHLNLPVSIIQHPASSVKYQSSIQHPTSSIQHLASSIQHGLKGTVTGHHKLAVGVQWGATCSHN